MPEPRVAGLLGRKHPKPPGKRFALHWAHEYLVGKLPTPVYPINVSEGIADWGMLGNAKWSDCFVAAELHYEMTTAKAAGTTGPNPSDTQVAVSRFVRFTGDPTPPGPGGTVAEYLHWLYKKGIVKAFAPVTLNDLRTQDALMQAGFGLLIGVLLTSDAQTEFGDHVTWGEPANRTIQPTDNLGHAILRIGASGSLNSDESAYVTWGAIQFATRNWDRACLEEAWLVVTKEEQLAKFTPQLIADIEALEKGTSSVSTTSPSTRTAIIQQIEQDAEQIEQLTEELVPTTPVTPPATPPSTPPVSPNTTTTPTPTTPAPVQTTPSTATSGPPATDTDTPGPAATTPAPVPATTAPTTPSTSTSTSTAPLPSTTPAPVQTPTTAALVEQIGEDAAQIVSDDELLAQREAVARQRYVARLRAVAGNKLTSTGRPAGVPWG